MSNLDILTSAAEIKAANVQKKIAHTWAIILVWLLVPYYLIKGAFSWKGR
jgi:hypothetical protein